jgi:hypothetical protein
VTTKAFEELIAENIKGLPNEALAEIADFILFVRKRVLQPDEFESELRNALLRLELKQSSRKEEAHLEGEFDDYEQRHPRE